MTSFISACIVFSSCFIFVLSGEYNCIVGLFFLAGTVALLVVCWGICIILIKSGKQYYTIEKDKITLWHREEKLYELNKTEMIEISYVRFWWAFLMQMGAGYMLVSCPQESLPDKKFASVISPDGIAIFEISMSKKQAKSVAKILGRSITIK